MNNLENRRKPLVDNSFGKTWLGCLVNKLGGNWQEVYCRGSWRDLDWNGAILRFNTETAWGPMNEVFKFIKTIYPSLKIYYQAEEDGMGVFITNDAEGSYFLTSAMHHPKTLIGQALLHQTIVNYTKFFSNKIIKVSLFDITI